MLLTEISTVSQLYESQQLIASSHDSPLKADGDYNNKISLIRHDITRLEVDAIVNAANSSLSGGGGVDGAIHRAAGSGLLHECRSLGGCQTGSAKITGAYRLSCKKVIHAVGPIYNAYTPQQSADYLRGCYRTSLDLAVQNDCRSIAFAALSTGIYGYPSLDAATVAISAVRAWLDEDHERAKKIERIVFCQFLEKDEVAYHQTIPRFFPPITSDDDWEVI